MKRFNPAPVCVLATGPMPFSEGLGDGFVLHPLSLPRAGSAAQPVDDLPAEIANSIRAIAASGPRRITADLMDSLPALQIIANFGVGFDRVDVEAATERGIVVTNTPDVLTEEVADFTIGLLLATVRRIVDADRFIRDGTWATGTPFPLSASLRNRRIGLVGMGRIGAAIAQRCAAMGLRISYFSRTRRTDIPHDYFDDPVSLAKAVDVLIVIVPGDSSTFGLVGRDVIRALGPDGILVNVARGNVVDEDALTEALEQGMLLAAGLDVFAQEPTVPHRLIALPNVVLTPHIGSATRATRDAMGNLVLANIRNWFAGKGALNPVNRIAAE